MLAFEVTVNGTRRYVAGHADAQSMQLILWGGVRPGSAGSLNTFVAVPSSGRGGLSTLSYEPQRMAIGDEITIRIVEVETPDAPMKRNDGQGGYQIESGVSE